MGPLPLQVAAYNFPSLPRANTSSWNFPHAQAMEAAVNGISAPSGVAGQPTDSNPVQSLPSHHLCSRSPDAPSAKTSIVPGKRLHATGALVRPIGTPTEPNHAAGDPIDSNPPHSVPLSVPWTNSPSGPRATSWISPGAVAQAPIGQSTGTVVLPSRASGTPRDVGGWNSPRSRTITSSSPAGPRQKTVTRRSPLAAAAGDETFSAIADQRRGFAIGAMIRQLEACNPSPPTSRAPARNGRARVPP